MCESLAAVMSIWHSSDLAFTAHCLLAYLYISNILVHLP